MEVDHHNWLVISGLITSSLIAVTANSFLLFIFCRKRSLRTVPNRFVVNLLVTNILSSVLLIPLLLTDEKIPRSPSKQDNVTTAIKALSSVIDLTGRLNKTLNIITNGDISFNGRTLLCYFAQSSTSFVCTASIFSILLISVNQYFGVIHSLRYHVYITKCRSTVLIASSWILSFLFGIFASLTKSQWNTWHFCTRQKRKHSSINTFNSIYAFTYFILVILLPFVAICVIYVCISKAAHSNSERMRKSTSSTCTLDNYVQYSTENHLKIGGKSLTPNESRRTSVCLPKVHSAPNFLQLQQEQGNQSPYQLKEVVSQNFDDFKQAKDGRDLKVHHTNFLTSIKHKISTASAFRYREEIRAAKISFLVIITVFTCYIPYGVSLILNSQLPREQFHIFNYLAVVLLIISNIISPFLFAYRNKRVKREIVRLLGLEKNIQYCGNLPNKRAETTFFSNKSFENINEAILNEPFLRKDCLVPQVIVTCKVESERKSILKRVCNGSNWNAYKKCNFITVPDCMGNDSARGSFSSASTQLSSEE